MRVEFDLYGTDLVSEKERQRIISLTQRFDPDEYGVACPSAGVRGAEGARLMTQVSLKGALRAAYQNFGVDFDLWWVDITCLDKEPVEISNPGRETYFKYLNWSVRLRPKVR